MTNATRAAARMMAIPRDAEDRLTSLADCRIALCVAAGTDLNDIHPAQGWDISERAYRNVRDSWARFAVESGSICYRPDWAKARDDWRRYRPDLAGDWPDWPDEAATPSTVNDTSLIRSEAA